MVSEHALQVTCLAAGEGCAIPVCIEGGIPACLAVGVCAIPACLAAGGAGGLL